MYKAYYTATAFTVLLWLSNYSMVLDSFYEYNISTNVFINEQIYMFYEI